MMVQKKNLIEIPLADLLKLEQPYGELPGDLKEEVFKSIDNIELTADIIDLFTFKYAHAEASLFGQIDEEE